MGCNHPLHAFDTGEVTENGKPVYMIVSGNKPYVPYRAACQFTGKHLKNVPTSLIGNTLFLTNPIDIPCGHCVGCRMQHAKEWSVRCSLERENYSDDECLFLTLTYDPRHLPFEGQLCKKDLQDFWKRLRRAGYKFRYFACGEYGEQYQRPHYHAIVFGLRLTDLVFYSMSNNMSSLYSSKELQRIWSNGAVSIGYADSASIAYVAGYCEKKQNDPHWNDYKVKPFTTMSRKPALGTQYLMDNERSIIATNKVYGDFGSTHSFGVPRHFIRKLGEKDEIWLSSRSIVMQERGKQAKILERAVYCCSDDYYIGEIKDELALMKLKEIKRS